MAALPPSSPHREVEQQQQQPPPQADPDSDAPSVTRATGGRRKRARSNNEDKDTPACDQCRLRKIRCDRRQPECSNCRKSGVECSSSSTLKRINHTKLLRDDFSFVLQRLDQVDQTLATLTEFTRQLAARPCSHVANVAQPHDLVPLPSPEPINVDQPDTPVSVGPLASKEPAFETVELDDGGERVYGYPAPLVLIKSLLRQTGSPLVESDEHGENHGSGRESYIAYALQDPRVRATLQKKLDEFPFQSRRPESTVTSDLNPITTPPRLMVNLFVDGYLKHINSRTPIFDDSELHRAIEAHYGDEQPQEGSAMALIINNIVLLEFGMELQAARASHSNSRGMNDDILPSFLKNCDRAIANLDAFMEPSLVNVQALMTLTLAAREFYSLVIAQRVCHAACQAGRALGLYRSKARPRGEGYQESEDSDRIRRRLFQVLYTMDKQRVFVTGLPCDLHMFDSDHSPFDDPLGQLMTIWEEIYMNLYTSRASKASVETRARQMRQLHGSLNRFSQKHTRLLFSPPNTTSDVDLAKIELVYAFQVSQILVLRCERGDENSQEKLRDLSRASLKLILEVSKSPLDPSRLALLSNLIGSYPMIAFFELVSFRLAELFKKGEHDAAAKADVLLLRATCDHLDMPEHNKKFSHIFYHRMRLGLGWALDVLQVLGEALTSLPASRDSRNSTSSSACNSKNPPSPVVPELLNGCPLRLPKVYQGQSGLSPSHSNETSFPTAGLAELAGFGFFTPPDTDPMDLSSRPLTAACEFPPPVSSSSMIPDQSELTSDFLTGNTEWNNFNMDFFQGVFGPGTRWE
ncbi:hypothetical protein PFICI_09707 [Pestalotiopsis fici W106-1]|uniref:Zn(2)-C6 fungal-type domain-containing protein n=1 Tax=Pestalotiopsis fici (strain W106-1 / CGMCC3.15140) TaxID=1229662 RepID=W3WUY4_PESFW|nr:uncharacterized protein PFICI_09707 [Pestalotiopsis fici W106-1]ETS77645.1 hypothetical protein PFICI_09707 [Pestalotiopsis fici W106-1]